MNDMHDLKKLKDMLLEELSGFGQGKELTTGSIDLVDKLAHTVKNLCKIIESADDEESSERSMRGSYRGSYRMGGSYADEGGSYTDGSYRRRRDSMGRYSRDGYSRANDEELHEIVDQLRSMAKDLPQPTQRAIQQFAETVD